MLLTSGLFGSLTSMTPIRIGYLRLDMIEISKALARISTSSILLKNFCSNLEIEQLKLVLIIWGHRAGYIVGPFRLQFGLPVPSGSIFQLSIC